jgi:hypothetical protein
MRKPDPVLATAAEIRQIKSRADDLLDAILGEEDDDDDLLERSSQRQRTGQRIEAVIQALRFCALAAGELGDPALLPVVADAIETCKRFDDHSDDHPTTLGVGLTLLLQAGAPVDKHVKRLAKDRDARIREAVAEGLRPQGEAELGLLEALSTDGIAQVRNAAKRTLAKVREVAWWKGKFTSDPVARLSPEEAERHKSTFERLSGVLDLARYYLPKHEAEIVELADALPDPLTVEVAEMILSAQDPYGILLPSLGTIMLKRPGGTAAFIRVCAALCDHRTRFMQGSELARMFLPLSRELRVAACKELTAYAVGLSAPVRCEQMGTPARLVAETVAKAWPPGEDPTPLLDALLSLSPTDEYALDWVVCSLDKVFTEEGADPTPILDRAVEAHLAGYPGAWKNIRGAIHTMLESASGLSLRAAAEQFLLRDDEDDVRWGIKRLLSNAHDPARDPPPAEMVARLYAEPKYRKALNDSGDLCERALPLFRADLREGKLGFVEAAATMCAIGELYGEVTRASYVPHALHRPKERVDQWRAEKIAKLSAFLGPPELSGPPTDAEWRALRAARPAYLATEGHDVTEIFKALPPGPWHPEDRAALDLVVQGFRGGDLDLTIPLALALAAKPEECDLPLFDVLLKESTADELSLIRSCRAYAMRDLGIEVKVATEGAPKDGDGDDEDAWPGEDNENG